VRKLAVWMLGLVGCSLVCVGGAFASALFNDGEAALPAWLFGFFGTLTSFAHATTLSLMWWATAGAALVAFRLRYRATAI
jgi:hypothetical protein